MLDKNPPPSNMTKHFNLPMLCVLSDNSFYNWLYSHVYIALKTSLL